MSRKKDDPAACNAYGIAAYAFYKKNNTLFCGVQDVNTEKSAQGVDERMAGVCAWMSRFLKGGRYATGK